MKEEEEKGRRGIREEAGAEEGKGKKQHFYEKKNNAVQDLKATFSLDIQRLFGMFSLCLEVCNVQKHKSPFSTVPNEIRTYTELGGFGCPGRTGHL